MTVSAIDDDWPTIRKAEVQEMGEDRRESDQHLGYIHGKLEGLAEKMDEHLKWDKEVHTKLDQQISGLVQRVEALDDHIRTAKGIVTTAKLLFAVVIGIITWKVDAAKAAWLAFWRSM